MGKAFDLVGIDEIAEMLGVDRRVVSVWQGRGWPAGSRGANVTPPKVLGVISGRMRVYDRKDVERWARETGRTK